MAASGGSWKAGAFTPAGGVSEQSVTLRASIAAKGAQSVDKFAPGDMFLFGNNVGRITKVTGDTLSFESISPTGGLGDKYSIARFPTQRLTRVTPAELAKAQSLASRVGGFKASNPLEGLNEAVGRTLALRK